MGRRKASSLKLKTLENASKKQPLVDVSSHQCRKCGKVFKSSKAVHGHMRCHTDRFKNHVGVPPPISLTVDNSVGLSSYELGAAVGLFMLAGRTGSVEIIGPASVSPERAAQAPESGVEASTAIVEEQDAGVPLSGNPLARQDMNQLPGVIAEGNSSAHCSAAGALVLDLSLRL